MKIQLKIWHALPLITLLWANPSFAVSVGGIAVGDGGLKLMVGTDPATLAAPNTGKIEYYIPLSDGAKGVYGDPGGTCLVVGACSDGGSGSGYAGADALMMNIFFDLSGPTEVGAATLDFVFDDLDLAGINDPWGFKESISLSYWDGSTFKDLTGVIFDPADMSAVAGSSVDSPPNEDPITWSLDLAALDLDLAAFNILGDLNNTRSVNGGFWIQLGFGSQYLDYWGNPKHGYNTPEYLTANLTVSPVPLPSAVWLFGSALIGFIGMSRRTRV